MVKSDFGYNSKVEGEVIVTRADAVVIGTRLIQEIEAAGPAHAVERAAAFIQGIRQAMDAGVSAT